MPKMTVTVCFWMYFELTVISFAALLHFEVAGLFCLFLNTPTSINVPLCNRSLNSLAACVMVGCSAFTMLWLCCVCVDFVLVCAVFQWYLILGGAVFLMATSSAQTPPGGAREQSWFPFISSTETHLSLFGYSVTPAAFLIVCVYGSEHAPTCIQIQILWSFLCFSLVFSCLMCVLVRFLCAFLAGSWPNQWCFDQIGSFGQ